MASKTKSRPAKMGHTKTKTQDESSASKLVILTGSGHKVEKSVDLKAVCGVPRIGWRFGTDEDVTCVTCREEPTT